MADSLSQCAGAGAVARSHAPAGGSPCAPATARQLQRGGGVGGRPRRGDAARAQTTPCRCMHSRSDLSGGSPIPIPAAWTNISGHFFRSVEPPRRSPLPTQQLGKVLRGSAARSEAADCLKPQALHHRPPQTGTVQALHQIGHAQAQRHLRAGQRRARPASGSDIAARLWAQPGYRAAADGQGGAWVRCGLERIPAWRRRLSVWPARHGPAGTTRPPGGPVPRGPWAAAGAAGRSAAGSSGPRCRSWA